MHRYIARFIGCLILALVFSIPAFLAPRMPSLIGGKNQITIRTDGQTSDIIAAVESLKREDISMRTTDKAPSPTPFQVGTIGLLTATAGLWIACGVVRRIEHSLVRLKAGKG